MRTRVTEWSRPAAAGVKGWKRHFEGWQAGVVAIFIAGTASLLAVPRSVAPLEIPELPLHPAALAAVARDDAARAASIEASVVRGELDLDVRKLGKAVRAFGQAETQDSPLALESASRDVREAAREAIARSPEQVLSLRAYQTRAFLRAARAFERTGAASSELVELGGVFARSASAYRWYSASERRLFIDDAALSARFKQRWNELTALKGPVFALTADEKRALQRFLLAHPPVELTPLAPGATLAAVRAHELDWRVAVEQRRLQLVRDLARTDPDYPASLAEGVLQFRLGHYEAAAIAFERHLDVFPDGPWTLRARNYLKASLEAR